MINKFTKYLLNLETKQALMPLYSLTYSHFLANLILEAEGSLLPNFNKIFSEKLIVLSYGKPQWNSRNKSHQSSTPRLALPVIFILHPSTILGIDTIYPFDTYAFNRGLFKPFFKGPTHLEDFKVVSNLHISRNIVELFFSTNEMYFDAVVPVLSIDESQNDASNYYRLLSQVKTDLLINYATTIEVHTKQPIKISHDTLLAVILPIHTLDYKFVKEYFIEFCKTKIITYSPYTLRTQASIVDIKYILRDFLTKCKILNYQV